MTRFLTIREVLWLHTQVIASSGGGAGVRDFGALQSAVAQPRATFGGNLLYTSLVEQAAALAFSLVGNHPFVDGNKRVGHASMEMFLLLNGRQLQATVDEQERVFLDLAAGLLTREELITWLSNACVQTSEP